MPRTTAWWAALVVLPLVLPPLAAATRADDRWEVRNRIVVDRDVWRWNWASWDQDKVVSCGNHQYTVFWDADGVFVLARRNLNTNDLQTLRFPDFKLSSDDAHRNTCLGVSPADGRLHLSWDHHNNPLHYTRSRAGFLTASPPSLNQEDIEPPQEITAMANTASRVTYPRFLNDATGQLFLFYRQGGSGNGDNYLHRYDAASGSWKAVGKAFSARGVYGPWKNDATRNAYFHDLLFDSRNRLHATWVYREVAETWASNHDLHYAYSDDGGLTWQNNAGQQIADLAADDPIELTDHGIVVREIPVFSWIMNAGCMALDSHHRPHVVTFKLPEPRQPESLQHSPPQSIMQDLRFVHFWRADDGAWRGGEPISAGAEAGLTARGDMVFTADDTLYFYYQPRGSSSGFQCLSARAADQWQSWRSFPLTGSEITGLDASKHDRRRWTEHGILSLTARTGTQGFAIVDLMLRQ